MVSDWPSTFTVAVYASPLSAESDHSVACTAVAYGLFNAGLRTVPSGAASILTLWEPLTAAVLAVLLLGETLSPAALVGSALLLGSVMLSYLR